jgi:hypothetical protein
MTLACIQVTNAEIGLLQIAVNLLNGSQIEGHWEVYICFIYDLLYHDVSGLDYRAI